jgi:hypothetical protein
VSSFVAGGLRRWRANQETERAFEKCPGECAESLCSEKTSNFQRTNCKEHENDTDLHALCQTLPEDNRSTCEHLIYPINKASRKVSLANATSRSY